MTTTARIRCTALLFAAAADAADARRVELELPVGADADQALDELCRLCPAIAPLRNRLAFAVSDRYVAADHVLNDGDELALIPPVSGG